MPYDAITERFFETLITGNRPGARKVILEAYAAGYTPTDLYTELFWPTYQMIEKLHRSDQLSNLSHHLATRLLRVLVDQSAAKLHQGAPRDRRTLCFCGPSESDEMGAQMAVDLLEASGFDVTFAGGGIAGDEIMSMVQEVHPDILLVFASAPADLPSVRIIIDQIRENGACPNMQIAVGAGVFSRATGLAEEIGADVWADSPMEMVDTLISEPTRRAEASERTLNKVKRAKKAA
ncbi:hypothetical protein BH11PLA1_BH11PLA1_17980 [soil metagenome]